MRVAVVARRLFPCTPAWCLRSEYVSRLFAGDTIGMFEVLFASLHAFTAIATSDAEITTIPRHVCSALLWAVQHTATRTLALHHVRPWVTADRVSTVPRMCRRCTS